MTTLAPITTPARQPFGVLNDSKLRNLQSIKNRQNAITPNSAPTSLKRRAASPDGGSDSENIDPSILESLHKRKRSALEDDVSISKANRYSLQVKPQPTSTIKHGSRLNPSSTVVTPRLDTYTKPAPASAPAGRSPTNRRPNSLLNPRKRFNPPPFSVNTHSPSLTLAAALNGTKKSRLQSQARKSRPKTTPTNQVLETSQPKSWSFDIYEESQEQQEYRMNEWTMTQDTTGLDISDDESTSLMPSKFNKAADRGKENVDPNEEAAGSAPVTRSMAAAAAAALAKAQEEAKDVNAMKTDMDEQEPRSPLADLDPAGFYAEGLDATSVVLVHDDEAETDIEDSDDVQKPTEEESDFTFQAPSAAAAHSSLAKTLEEINAPSLEQILSAATPFDAGLPCTVTAAVVSTTSSSAVVAESGDIEIWESESAKDEDETEIEDQQNPNPTLSCLKEADSTGGDLEFGDENVFACQEL